MKKIFLLSCLFVCCYAMEPSSYYEMVIDKERQPQPINTMINYFELHLKKGNEGIDLTDCDNNIQAETLKITGQNWKVKDFKIRRRNFFLFLLQHANKAFKIESQTKISSNIIATQLEQPYAKNIIHETYKRLSKVDTITYPESPIKQSP